VIKYPDRIPLTRKPAHPLEKTFSTPVIPRIPVFDIPQKKFRDDLAISKEIRRRVPRTVDQSPPPEANFKRSRTDHSRPRNTWEPMRNRIDSVPTTQARTTTLRRKHRERTNVPPDSEETRKEKITRSKTDNSCPKKKEQANRHVRESSLLRLSPKERGKTYTKNSESAPTPVIKEPTSPKGNMVKGNEHDKLRKSDQRISKYFT